MKTSALITGGSRGLGRSTALALAEQGCNIIITYLNNHEAATEVCQLAESQGVHAAAICLDSRKTADYPAFAVRLRAQLQSWGQTQIRYLVNNAGTGLHREFATTTMEEFDNLYELHLKAPYFLTQTLLEDIADQGHILNISSGLARFSLPGSSAYAMMKGGVEVFTRYLARELGGRGISVNTIAPGAIATDFSGGTVRDNPQVNDFVSSVTAKGRAGEAGDIGRIIARILHEDSYWMTGQRIEVSGGMFL